MTYNLENHTIRQIQDLGFTNQKRSRELRAEGDHELADHFQKKCDELLAQASEMRLEEMGLKVK
jgi:hypothetical protein